jgi:hypothetical protein
MGGNRSHDRSGNPARAQPSYAKSLLIGAAGTLAFLIGDPRKPDKEDEPFGTQSRQENMQTQFKRAEEPGRERRAESSFLNRGQDESSAMNEKSCLKGTF